MTCRPSFCVVNIVSNPAFPAGPDSVFLTDYQNQTHISIERARQREKVRRQGAFCGKAVLFQSETACPREIPKDKNNHILGNYTAKLSKDCFLVFSNKQLTSV